MIRRNSLKAYLSMTEIADLLNQPENLIRRMVNAKRCPGWIWKLHWKQPRFAQSSIPEWLRLLDEIDLDTLPLNPPPLERPEQVFKQSRKAIEADMKLF